MKNILTIPLSQSFLETLAEGLLNKNQILGNAINVPLYEVVIGLPTHRACLKLTEILLQKQPAMLLPTITPLGNIEFDDMELGDSFDDKIWQADAMPKEINKIERHLILSCLIQKNGFMKKALPSRHLNLAFSLAKFIDLTDRFEVEREKIKTLAPENFAEHWQNILKYLSLLVDAWPTYLKKTQQKDPVSARNIMLRQFADSLNSFSRPFIIAGSTGSQPATSYLIKKTIQYKNGIVILPSLDVEMADEDWKKIKPTHPQFGLKTLLEKIDITRNDVVQWKRLEKNPREILIRHLFNPTPSTQNPPPLSIINEGAKDIILIEADNNRQEAESITLEMLAELKNKSDNKKTIALITPDKALARRVRLSLARFEVEIDDEAGSALTMQPVFVFLKLIAEMAIKRWELLPLLSCLKHPLALAGGSTGELNQNIRAIEFKLRGLNGQLGKGFNFYQENVGEEHYAVLEKLKLIFSPLDKFCAELGNKIKIGDFLELHITVAENLATSAKQTGAETLWRHNEVGAEIAAHIRVLLENKALLNDLGEVVLDDYPIFFENLFASAPPVRPHRSVGSNLHIWQPAEARLQKADLVILGGLNDAVWPSHINPDPWLNRAMRENLGLEKAEAQIGLSARDFIEGLSHQKIILTRSKKSGDGNPIEPSPWLLQMKNILGNIKEPKDLRKNLSALHHCKLELAEKKLPTPLLNVKPKKISASAFTELLNNPYSFYANRILKLKPLAELESEPQAAELGSAIHDILHKFVQSNLGILTEISSSELIDLGKSYFETNAHPIIKLFWGARFEKMAIEFIALEKNILRQHAVKIFTEIEGEIEKEINHTKFILTARADRIDISPLGASIYDYKTGTKPKKSSIPKLAPQLPFEAVILKNGGFENGGIKPIKINLLAHILLKNERAARMFDPLKNPKQIIEETEKLIQTKLNDYISDEFAWEASKNSQYKTYNHLARLK